MSTTENPALPKVVLVQDPTTQEVHTVRIGDEEIAIANASPFLQNGKMAVSLTILGVSLDVESGARPTV